MARSVAMANTRLVVLNTQVAPWESNSRVELQKKEDVLFCLPPTARNNLRYPLGVLYIAAYMRSKGYDCQVFDYPESIKHKNYTETMAISDCIEFDRICQPKVIFFSAHTTEALETIHLMQKLKEICNFVSVAGGYHASSRPQDFFENGFDFVLEGEGEYSAYQLIHSLATGEALRSVSGLAWKDGATINTNSPADFIENLDDLPFPAYDKVNMEKYVRMSDGIIRGLPLRAVNVTASRGCNFKCSFCASPDLSGRKLRFRSPENIEREIRFLRDSYDVEAIWFTDDTLTASRVHVRKVCQVMKELGMYWGCQARVDCLNEETLKLLKNSNCLQLDFGIESGSRRVLEKIIFKGFYPEKVIEVFDLCHKYRIRTLANFIIGLPTETLEELNETIALAKRIRCSFYRLNLAVPLPGTKLDKMIGEELSIEEYAALDFSGSTSRYNKSLIPNVCERYHALNRRMLLWTLKYSLLRDLPIYLKVMWTLPRKRERLTHVLRHVTTFLARSLRSEVGDRVRRILSLSS